MPLRIEETVTRDQVWLRMFIHAMSGGGKSRGALEIASRIFGGDLPIVLINTEPNRGKLYADRFKYSLVEMSGDFGPQEWIKAFDAAERLAPGGVIIGDSVTSEWYGTGGITQIAHRFTDWGKARPLHQEFVDRMNVAQAHVIMCCRSKMKHEQITVEDGKGGTKFEVVPLGVGPMQDADFQYEFNLTAQLDRAHVATFSGHIDTLVDTQAELVGEDADLVADAISAWCSIGTPIEAPEAATDEQVAELVASLTAEGIKPDVIEEKFAVARRQNRGQLSPVYVAEQHAGSQKRLAAKRAKAEKASGSPQEPAGAPAAPEGGPTAAQPRNDAQKGAQPAGAPA